MVLARREKNPGVGYLRHRHVLLLQVQYYALYPSSKTDSRSGLTPQLLNQVVIAAATADSTLRAFMLRLNLEYRLGVIVQTAHQAVVYGKGQPQ